MKNLFKTAADFERFETEVANLVEQFGDKVNGNYDYIEEKVWQAFNDNNDEETEITVDLARTQGIEFEAELHFEATNIELDEDDVPVAFELTYQ